MTDIRERISTQEMHIPGTYWRGIIILLRPLILVSGLTRGGRVMRESIQLKELLEDMILIMILMHVRGMINFEVDIVLLMTTVIMVLIVLLGLGIWTVMTMGLMIMGTDLAFHINIERIAVKGIMDMTVIVMTLIMRETVGEMAI